MSYFFKIKLWTITQRARIDTMNRSISLLIFILSKSEMNTSYRQSLSGVDLKTNWLVFLPLCFLFFKNLAKGPQGDSLKLKKFQINWTFLFQKIDLTMQIAKSTEKNGARRLFTIQRHSSCQGTQSRVNLSSIEAVKNTTP